MTHWILGDSVMWPMTSKVIASSLHCLLRTHNPAAFDRYSYLRLEILKYTLMSYRVNRSSSQLLKKEGDLLRSKGNNCQISSRIPLITVKPRVGSREATTGGFCQSMERP